MKTNRVIGRDTADELDISSRIRLEAELTDQEGEDKSIPHIPNDWQFEDYRNYRPHRAYIFSFLGSLTHQTVLDLGCGYHPTPVYFALAGAKRIIACDVSFNAVAYMQKMAAEAGVSDRLSVVVCAGEQLLFADESMNLIHGEAVLHHLDIPMSSGEVARTLKRGGKAAFKDPLGQNPLLEFARDYLPYSWKKSAKGTDSPMTFKKIETFGKAFSTYTYHGFGLLSLFAIYFWGRQPSQALRLADLLDSYMLRSCPLLQRWCRFVVTCVRK